MALCKPLFAFPYKVIMLKPNYNIKKGSILLLSYFFFSLSFSAKKMIKPDIWSPLLVALVASMTQAFGISLQRKSHLLADNNSTTIIPHYKRPMWISGFLIYTISNLIASTCTIGYLPIVILAPVGAIGLVFNAIFAKWILGDPFTKRTIIGKSIYMHFFFFVVVVVANSNRHWIDCTGSWISSGFWNSARA